MPSARGVVVLASGVALWLLALLLGSPTVHIAAVGVLVLPLVTAALGRRARQRLEVHRHLSDVRVEPGRRVSVELEVENPSLVPTSLVLLEDRAPGTLGAPARLVLPGVAARTRQRVSYVFSPTTRGRYRLGPITVDLSDPFALTRRRFELARFDHLVVTPELEDLTDRPGTAMGQGAGISRTRTLMRSGEEFSAMRAYQEGDDLRRIHWRSTARRGELMIRQDETTRRGQAVVMLDTRAIAVGRARDASFERCVSCAASIGALLVRSGFGVRLLTAAAPLLPVNEESLLDALAEVTDDPTRSLRSALGKVRAAAAADTTLVLVSAPPTPNDLPTLLRAGTGFGPRLAVLVHPTEPSGLPADRRAQLEDRASQSRAAFARSGWDVVVLSPSTRLKDVWTASRERLSAAASSR